MTTTEVPAATCPSCRLAARPDARFCVGCGAAIDPVGVGAAAPHPYATWHAPAPGAAAARPKPVTALVALAVVLLLLCAVAATLLVVGPFGAVAGPGVAAPSAPSAAGPAAGAPPADPAAELQTLRRDDRAAATALVGQWVPQLSTKRPGLVAEGRTWDAASILAEHRELRARYPQARLVWSGDYASFRGDDFWVTVLARPSSSASAANAWCDDAGLDGDHCYAKRLTTNGGPDGNAVQRDGATGSGATTGATSAAAGSGEPVVGDSGWAPGVIGYGTARPSELNANGDGTSAIRDLTWQSWGGPTATGRGTASYVPPDGYVSDGRPAPAVVVASDLGDCNGHLGYRRVVWYFPSKGETAPAPGDGYDEEICRPY